MKILIIEENNMLADSIQKILNHNGYETLVAYDALYGLGLILNGQNDLVILDLNLHHISAKELLKTCFLHKINIPFVAITKKEILTKKILNYEIVANEYLLLPFDTKTLITKIKQTYDLYNEQSFVYKDINVLNFALKNESNKQYLTTTEILILKELCSRDKVFNKDLLKYCLNIEDLWVYIDSLNEKLKKVYQKYQIVYQNNYYRLEVINY